MTIEKPKVMTVVNALECQKCFDVIYSRAHHDCYYCSCDSVMVDGGFTYFRCGGSPSEFKMAKISVPFSKKQIAMDYISGKNKLGLIPKNKVSAEIKAIFDEKEVAEIQFQKKLNNQNEV
jgi:hypothetical protein